MNAPYLLDTSAFRAISGQHLATLAQRRPVLVSPYCFWEILTHLDGQDRFVRTRGMLMKFRHVGVLDDPHAAAAADLRTAPAALPARVSDDELIYASLAALRDSNTLAEFYSKQIADSQGNARLLSDCVARARIVLATEENQFTIFVRQIMEALAQSGDTLRTPMDLHRATLSLLNGWPISQLGRSLDDDSDHRILRRLYVHFCFVTHCARHYLADLTRKFDGNDFEDARLCQHVSLDAPYVIVSADHRLRSLLEDVLALPESLGDPRLSHSLRVCGLEELS